MEPETERKDRDADEVIQDLFDASRAVYELTVKFLSEGNHLEPGERAPVAIAFEVAMTAIKYQKPCPEWAAKAVTAAWSKFNDYECKSITDAFEIPEHKHVHAKRDQLLSAAVYHRVRALQKKGTPLKDNATGKGALSQVGDQHHMSGKKVEKLMERWKDLCRITGSDPDASLNVADAEKVVSAALAKGLAAWKGS